MKQDCIYVVPDPNNEEIVENVLKNEDQDFPIYICNVDDLIFKYKTWKRLFPRIQPHYAVKSNNHPIVLQVLASLGASFDCASKNEIEQILSLGVDPSRIIFAHTTKSTNSIMYAQKHNVRLMTFDSEVEIHKIFQMHSMYHSQYQRTPLYYYFRAVLRIKNFVYGDKFGCDLPEVEKLLTIALKENVNVVGVSFPIGFATNSPFEFYEAIREARYAFQIGAKLGFNFNLLDIGGGYPGTRDDTLLNYAEQINKGLEDYFSDVAIRVISEPGTFFVQSAFTLACCVQLVKSNFIQNVDDYQTSHYDYHINDGIFGSFSMAVYLNREFVPRPLKKSKEELFLSTVWGPTCYSGDKVNDNIMLPKLDVGDWLIFTNAGNYTHVVCSNFNGFGLKKIYCFASHQNMLELRDTWLANYSKFIDSTQKFS